MGLFVALVCMIATARGLTTFFKWEMVKKVEGVPVSEADMKIIRQRQKDEENTLEGTGITDSMNVGKEKKSRKLFEGMKERKVEMVHKIPEMDVVSNKIR